MEDKLLSMQVGSFGIILTRRSLLYAVMVITAGLAIYTFILVEEGVLHEAAPISAVTWTMYNKDCGGDAWKKSPKSVKSHFMREYHGLGVSWEGWVSRVNLNEDDPMSMAYHSASIMIKMDEDDTEGIPGPEIGLSIS
jgi:hypothetical protein